MVGFCLRLLITIFSNEEKISLIAINLLHLLVRIDSLVRYIQGLMVINARIMDIKQGKTICTNYGV